MLRVEVEERSYLSIGQVLDLLKREFPDLTISKIRFLESQGLLDPERTPSGYRKFYGTDVERLRFILREQQEHYLPLKVIRGRLGVESEDDDADPEDERGRDDQGRAGHEQVGGDGSHAGALGQVQLGVDDVGGQAQTGLDEAVAGRTNDAERVGPAAAVAAPARTRGRRTGARPGSEGVALGALAPAASRRSGSASETERLSGPGLVGSGYEREAVDTDEAALGSESMSLTFEELASATGLESREITELERFGLVAGRRMAGTTYYDADCVEIARLAAGFRSFGVEPRHLRMYRTAVEREAGFFEQVVTPMLKQRNPRARRQAVETLRELSRLGHAMRAAVLRQALRDYTGGPP